MATLIKTDGRKETVNPINPKKGFQLPELYALLECDMVEVVKSKTKGNIFIIDEAGKLKDKGVNTIATVGAQLAPYDVIVGHALLCKACELK